MVAPGVTDCHDSAIVEELNTPEPDLKVIAELISGDLGLSYKLLKLANSVYVGAKNKIKTIAQSLTTVGIRELYQWIILLFPSKRRNGITCRIRHY